jgi:hypothetical protein
MSKLTFVGRLALATFAFAGLAAAQIPYLVVNELDSDTPGSDVLEFIELFDGGTGSQSLVGYTLVFYNGNTAGDLAYFAMDLTGTTDGSGYYLVGNPAVSPTPAQTFAPGSSGALQNGADAVAIYFGAPASSWVLSGAGATPAATPPAGATLVDALVYGTADASDASLLASLLPGFQQIDEGGAGVSDVKSIGRCPDGAPNQLDTSLFQQMSPTPGVSNSCIPAFRVTLQQSCPGPITLSITGAQPFFELYTLIALTCSNPTGSGILFGINADGAAGQPLISFFQPLGSAPFHVQADALGNYTLVVPVTGLCPSPVHFTAEAVVVEAIGLGITNVTPLTTGCVIIDL